MFRSTREIWFVGCLAVLLAPSLATSQEQGELEEIVVTGSYLFNEVDSPSPVDVISGERLFEVPASNLSDFFYYDVPQNFGAEQRRYQDGGSGNHRSGARNTRINLRGLGSENTLILLNGGRLVDTPNPDTSGWRNVDISNIVPRIAIGQIQILHDGASATYGTDAVAGVVNFMTRDDFRGFDFNLDSRYYEQDTGLMDYTIGALWGGGDDNTSVIAAFEYHDEDPWYVQQVTGIPVLDGPLGPEFRDTQDNDASPNTRGLNTYRNAQRPRRTPTARPTGSSEHAARQIRFAGTPAACWIFPPARRDGSRRVEAVRPATSTTIIPAATVCGMRAGKPVAAPMSTRRPAGTSAMPSPCAGSSYMRGSGRFAKWDIRRPTRAPGTATFSIRPSWPITRP